MRTLDQIRRSHASARPKHDNPAWMHTHNDLTFVLGQLDVVTKQLARACYCDYEDGTECQRHKAIREQRDELLKLCELVAAFSAPRLRENSLWILADAVDQAKALLSSHDHGAKP